MSYLAWCGVRRGFLNFQLLTKASSTSIYAFYSFISHHSIFILLVISDTVSDTLTLLYGIGMELVVNEPRVLPLFDCFIHQMVTFRL